MDGFEQELSGAAGTSPRLPIWRRGVGRALFGNPLSAIGTTVLVVLGLVAVFAPSVAPFDPYEMNARLRLLPPLSGAHLLGTDEFGRDLLSRLIFGSRISLFVAVLATLFAGVFGSWLGVVAGFYGRALDHWIMRFVDVLFSFPSLLLAIAIVGLLGASFVNTVVAIGLVFVPEFARVSRGSVLSVKEKEFVEASVASGARDRRVILRHVLPNITAPLVVQVSVVMSQAILLESGLSFLGLGAQPPEASWGAMLSAGRPYMEFVPSLAILPGAAIMVVVLGLNLLGDGLRDAFDPRQAG